MSQSIAIMILGNPTAHNSPETALNFAKAVIASGHRIERLFFYHEGANLGSGLHIYPQDEINLPDAWQDFIITHHIDAVVCIASALKRGIIDASEAARHDKPEHNLLDGAFQLAGLGQWIEAVNNADKYIVFGA